MSDPMDQIGGLVPIAVSVAVAGTALNMIEDLEGITTGFNSVMIDTANEILGKECWKINHG